ncbi:MAG: ribosome biogenesis GTPase YlqF [Clostridia bacterium]|nr:ribosome biogenesis GTPase YlqF [Clostridia bacterium]
MIINWFPGHMTKSLREIDESIKLVDAIVYVLDSRAPISCINPSLNKVIGDKPIVYALNKADMVCESDLLPYVEKLTGAGKIAVKLNSTASNTGKIIAEKLRTLCSEKIERKKARGINAVIRAMVIGVPNSGKSTLINNICGKSKTLTGNKAGVTRGQQWVKIGQYLELLDTPGTLYPKLDNYDVALNLAFIGSIRDEVVDKNELALELIKKLTKLNKGIEERYGFLPSGDALCDLEKIASVRGFILKGGNVDYDRASNAILDDFRKGRMGKIILE